MNASLALTIAGAAFAVFGIALALVIGPMLSHQAAAKGGKPAPRALWLAIGAIDMMIGLGLIVWAQTA
ncbi:hypothetical protein [Sphingomonas sp.]|uniref:hypothetical protein n=1 Tax=Sphingomonas sp. TaxID=28214 RepID=UPI002ED9F336